LASVRAQDFPADDVAEAWAKTTQFALLTLALVGASPSEVRTRAVLGLFRYAASLLAPADHGAAGDGITLLEGAIGATEMRAKNRAAFDLEGRRDAAILAKRPALAAFLDGLSHAAEAVASHADGHVGSPPRRGLEAGRSLLFAVAEVRTGDGEDLAARKAAGRDLAAQLRRMLPGGPWG
jgi:hypothetical protein